VDWFGTKGLRDRRLLLPLGIAIASVVLILIVGRNSPWYLKIILALVAFLYMGLQSAFYLVPHEEEPQDEPKRANSPTQPGGTFSRSPGPRERRD
jgi:hypothetical protein